MSLGMKPSLCEVKLYILQSFSPEAIPRAANGSSAQLSTYEVFLDARQKRFPLSQAEDMYKHL